MNTIQSKFVELLSDALRGATLEELMALTGGAAPAAARRDKVTEDEPESVPVRPRKVTNGHAKSGGDRLPRRTAEEVAEQVDRVVEFLKSHPARAEEIRSQLDLDKRELPRIMKQALEDNRIKVVSGNKRSTTYGVAGRK